MVTSSPAASVDGHDRDFAAEVAILGRRTASVSSNGARACVEPACPNRQLLEDALADLHLSAEIGQALLVERTALLDRLADSEDDGGARKGHGRELTMTHKLQTALDEIDRLEAANRVLSSRSAEAQARQAKASEVEAKFRVQTARVDALSKDMEDLKQELAAEQSRAASTESRRRKAADRAADLERRLSEVQAQQPLGPHSPVRRRRPDQRALEDLVKLASSSGNAVFAQIVEDLTKENDSLHDEVAELQGLLRQSHDEQSQLRVDLDERRAVSEEDDSVLPSASTSLLSEVLMRTASPTIEFQPSSRSSIDRSWAPSTTYFGQRGPLSADSVANSDEHPPAQHTHYHYHLADGLRPARRRQTSRKLSAKGRRSDSAEGTMLSSAPTSPFIAEQPAPCSPSPLLPPLVVDRCSTKPPPSGPSGLSLSSPERLRPRQVLEIATQTEPPWLGQDPFARDTGTPDRATSLLSEPPSSMSDRDALDAALGPDVLRTCLLPELIAEVTMLLSRMQGANIQVLEHRLRKQNLRGDVKHLAAATIRDLTHDIEGLRIKFQRMLVNEGQPRTAADGASLVTRREFRLLIKLFRDLLNELSKLRSVVNAVTVDPSMAAHIAKLEAGGAADQPTRDASTLDAAKAYVPAILGPITRLWSGSGPATPESSPSLPSAPQTGRPGALQAGGRSTSIGVTNASVKVEFGGGGAVRRVTSIGDGLQRRTKTSPAPGLTENPPSREDVGRIFAGGALRRARSPWEVLESTPPPLQRDRLSKAADAMLDGPPAGASSNKAATGDFRETLLERTLRPRGLSDSSIRSTFIRDGAGPAPRLLKPSAPIALVGASSSPRDQAAGMSVPRRTGAGATGGNGAAHQLSQHIRRVTAPGTPGTPTPTASIKPVRVPSANAALAKSRLAAETPSSSPRMMSHRRWEGEY